MRGTHLDKKPSDVLLNETEIKHKKGPKWFSMHPQIIIINYLLQNAHPDIGVSKLI